MKKMIFAVLCLFLAACGTFAVRVDILPPMTAVPPTALPSAATATPLPNSSPTPAPVEPTATNLAAPTPTTVESGRKEQPLSLTAIQMKDIRRGWGVEASGRILKTSDGGSFWKDVSPAQAMFDRHGLFAFNNETAWVVPAQLDQSNRVWRTQDGGSTWEASQPIPLGTSQYSPLSLQFPDARHGWLLLLAQSGKQDNHAVLYKSGDGGASWELVSALNESVAQSYLPDTRTSMTFFDGQTGWIGGWWGKEDPTQWVALKTSDGGAKWGTDPIRLPDLKSLKCDGHPIPDMAPGSMAVEMTCTLPKDPKYLFHHIYYLSTTSSPAWRSWKLSGNFLSMNFLNANQGWMLVTSKKLGLNEVQYTRDGGGSWEKMSEVAWKQAQFNFVNDKIGWAIVGNEYASALVRTENGGKVWTQVRPAMIP